MFTKALQSAKTRRLFASCLLLLAGCHAPAAPPPPAASPGPDFSGIAWVDAAPDLRGRVALVRWWTNGCSMCVDSAPVLQRLSAKAAVVAIYHPKPPRDVAPETVRAAAGRIGMPGTVGIDRDWAVLERWKAGGSWRYTSLTFLVDRAGRVRYVHPGGTITEPDGVELDRRIDALLAEK